MALLRKMESEKLYPLLAAIAGSITALSFRAFKSMNKWEILLALFVGFAFSYFLSPIVIIKLYGSGPVDIRYVGALFYGLATGSNVFIPLAVRWGARFLGTKETGL